MPEPLRTTEQTSDANDSCRQTELPGDRSFSLVLFGGKGGVGKTTCALSFALHLSSRNPSGNYLVVSMDPAHSLRDCLGASDVPANLEVVEFDGAPNLEAFKTKHAGKLRLLAQRGTFLDTEDIDRFIGLSLPGLDEVMGFLQISEWLEQRKYACIVVDTAPTGHTLRLMNMPVFMRGWLKAIDSLLAKHRYMKKLFSGRYQPDEVDAWLTGLYQSSETLSKLLCNQGRCRFVPVMLAEPMSTLETEDLLASLKDRRVPVTDLIVNRIVPRTGCVACATWRAAQDKELDRFASLPLAAGISMHSAMLSQSRVMGVPKLTEFWDNIRPLAKSAAAVPPAGGELRVDGRIACSGAGVRLVVLAGKGGVGKTTVACATASRLASLGRTGEVLVLSCDPAHSLSDCLKLQLGRTPGEIGPKLYGMELDAAGEFGELKREYQASIRKFLKEMLPNMDLEFDREVMERVLDLSPPGIDEIMAISSVIDLLATNKYGVIVLDTAPTGHLIRLLEMPELLDGWIKAFFEVFLKYKNIFKTPELSQRLIKMSKELKVLRAMLRDPSKAVLYVVGTPDPMVLAETGDLIDCCRRMEIPIGGLVWNQVTPARDCPMCRARNGQETEMLGQALHQWDQLPQAAIYRTSELRGPGRLGELGEKLWKEKDRRRDSPHQRDQLPQAAICSTSELRVSCRLGELGETLRKESRRE